MHLADAFIQSDLQCIQVIHFMLVCSLGIEPTTFCAANAMLYHWATGGYHYSCGLCYFYNFRMIFKTIYFVITVIVFGMNKPLAITRMNSPKWNWIVTNDLGNYPLIGIIAIKLQRSVTCNTADYTNSSLTFLTLLFTLTATKCSSGTVLSSVSAVGVCVVVCGLKLCCFESLNGSPGPYWVLPPSHRSPLRSRLQPRAALRRASPYCCRPFLQHTPLKHKAG